MHIWNRFLHFISKLYPKYTIREKSIMRVTRNADIDAHDLYDEDMDYPGYDGAAYQKTCPSGSRPGGIEP